MIEPVRVDPLYIMDFLPSVGTWLGPLVDGLVNPAQAGRRGAAPFVTAVYQNPPHSSGLCLTAQKEVHALNLELSALPPNSDFVRDPLSLA